MHGTKIYSLARADVPVEALACLKHTWQTTLRKQTSNTFHLPWTMTCFKCTHKIHSLYFSKFYIMPLLYFFGRYWLTKGENRECHTLLLQNSTWTLKVGTKKDYVKLSEQTVDKHVRRGRVALQDCVAITGCHSLGECAGSFLGVEWMGMLGMWLSVYI